MTAVADFIARWKASGGSEQANSQLFLAELCDVLELPRPEPARPINEENTYSYERKVSLPRGDGTKELKRLDLYRKGCFVLESKQGQDKAAATQFQLPGLTVSTAVKRGSRQWEDAMQRARRQAEHYIRCLPASEGRPPFLIVCDVGHCFDLYTEFTCTGGVYLHFPDARNCRVMLDDLAKPEVRALFRAIWEDPLSLDPSRRAARVTEKIADHLATLARLLEADGHHPEKTAQFLMRCIFSMFAEDVGLIPAGSFTDILNKAILKPEIYEHLLRDLWTAMNTGGVSLSLERKLLRFNGKLFADPEVLPLEREHIGILLEASKADWREVEPAIFGTLLERALNPKERHKLGAHYTPRAYVERLVIPTVMQPLRQEWDAVQAAASLLYNEGKENEARKTVDGFHKRLLNIKVLDPACGSGNFLYVTLEHLKRLEGEILQSLESYGEKQHALLQVDPHQFLGLEINPRAAHIAEMVLWIGYLQWHYRTHGNVNPPEPVIRRFDNIQCRDAVMDGVTVAEWPAADFIVGNPPFVGGALKRKTFGDGYFDALTKTYAKLPESCDFVMYWWHKAAEQVRAGRARRFGFITTNSINQVFNRRVLGLHLEDKNPLHLAFAIPDHPWVDAADGAAVRIAMTIGEKGTGEGVLASVVEERETDGREIAVTLDEKTGVIHADLRQGANITQAVPLKANEALSGQGMKLHGRGFVVTPAEAGLLGLGRIGGLEKHIRPFRGGRDIADKPRGVMAIDLFGLSAEEVRDTYPEVYQWVYTRVKPERDQNNEKYRRENWWLFGRKNTELRSALAGLSRYIATVYVAKHRYFFFLPVETIPEDGLIAIASSDAFHLGVLSSRIHVCWALAAGGRMGIGNDPRYNPSVCFTPFPFPVTSPDQQTRIRDLGEKLDDHRKKRQAQHPDLTMTGLYNVLEALRQGRPLTDKEKIIHENGLVAILQNLHDELDAAVTDAYGWPADLADEEILSRLVALNTGRVKEEQAGAIRWLRPEYQTKSKEERKTVQTALALGDEAPRKGGAPPQKSPWPADLLEQMQSVRNQMEALRAAGTIVTPESIAKRFTRAPRAKVEEVLQALATLGFV
ncbi:MAG: class I SAM-dependent DNA methyltransferase [Betaproteobacteria bacterium]|nr:class I SAM-dependent DNA methyltransferase [Betaproteobacteria bacterium]